jgi:F-type H+-transporting ATPase subunit gamma
MASLKELKGRINSVKSTQKITKAKQMVAAAKLRRAQAAAEAARPYATQFANVMTSLAGKVAGQDGAPRLLAGTGKDQVHLLVVANSDKGLAGAFNANIVRAALLKAGELSRQGKTVLFYTIGRKGRAPIGRAYPKAGLAAFDTTTVREAGYAEAERITEELVSLYEAGKFDVAHLFYSRFRSALVQEPTERQIIPLENQASEQGASMTAMDNATRNAGELIAKLTIQYNRSRQAAITTELIEIIAGAEAL